MGGVFEGSIPVVVVETIQFKIKVRDINVQPAVAVYVRRIDAHARFVAAVFARRKAGDEGNILKGSVVLIEEQKIRPSIVGDSDVRPAVVVEVSEHDAHALGFGLAHTGGVAYVGEGAIVIVMIELGLLPFIVAGVAVRTVARP